MNTLARHEEQRVGFLPRKEQLLRNIWDFLRVAGLLLTDSLAIFMALMVAYRFASTVFGNANPLFWGFSPPVLRLLPIFLIIQLLILAHYDLYRTGDGRRNYRKVMLALSIGCMVLAVGTNMYGVVWFSRKLLILFWLFSMIAVAGSRWLVDKVASASSTQRSFLVIGLVDDIPKVEQVLQKINRHPYQYLGFIPVSPRGMRPDPPDFADRLAQLGDLIEENNIQEIIVIADLEKEQFLKVMDLCVPRGIQIYIFTELLQALPNPVSVNSINGMAIVEVHQPELKLSDAALKRVFDLVATGIGLLIICWVFMLIAIAIKLDSPGPVLFRQRRVGYKGKPFTFYKFRSMVADAEERQPKISYLNERQDPLMFKMKDDPRITRVGRFLRRASLDELPQLFNVLKGEMSLVGPRPPLPQEVEMYKEHHRQRLTVLPGITGMWQVNGRSDITDFEDVVRLDLAYIENWSLLLDFKILLQTIPVVIRSRGAF